MHNALYIFFTYKKGLFACIDFTVKLCYNIYNKHDRKTKTMWNFIVKTFKKYREQIMYLIFGGLTTLISWGVSSGLFYFAFSGNEKYNVLCNVISEVVAITFAYVTNKLFVFVSKTPDFKSFIKEILSFYALRILSTLLNIGAMYLLVSVWKAEFWVCKIAVNVVVIVLNYFFSKLFIFKKGDKKPAECDLKQEKTSQNEAQDA